MSLLMIPEMLKNLEEVYSIKKGESVSPILRVVALMYEQQRVLDSYKERIETLEAAQPEQEDSFYTIPHISKGPMAMTVDEIAAALTPESVVEEEEEDVK